MYFSLKYGKEKLQYTITKELLYIQYDFVKNIAIKINDVFIQFNKCKIYDDRIEFIYNGERIIWVFFPKIEKIDTYE